MTVDEELVAAGRKAVAAGYAATLSEWVEDGLRRRVHHDELLDAGQGYLEWFDSEFGPMSEEDEAALVAQLHARAITVEPADQAS